MVGQDDRAFGKVAVARGFVTQAQLEECTKLAAAVT